MRTLLTILAAFFAGMWLNERSSRREDIKRPINIIVPKPEEKPVDRRSIYELIPELNVDDDNFDTKTSLIEHHNAIIRKAMEMELTPLQASEFAEAIISTTVNLAYWDKEQEMKAEGL